MEQLKMMFNLQLFAEGAGATGAGATSGEAAGQAPSGENAQDAAGITGDNIVQDAAERAEAFAKFKADYKTEFDAEVQGIVKERLKKSKNFEKQANEYRDKTSKVFDSLAVKYGLDASDIDAIVKAVDEDNSFYEDEALKRGMDVSEFRHLKQIERENAIFRAQQQAEEMRQQEAQWYSQLAKQADDTKAVYPNFDMQTEAENNPQFKMLVEKGVDVKTAYEITHKDDVIAAAMKYAADTTADKMRNSVAQNSKRPSENGLTQNNAIKTTTDISKLTPKQMAEFKERARRGEKVTFQN